MGEKRTMQYVATFAVALASLTSSSSYSWTIPVLPKFRNNETHMHLTDDQQSWVVSASAPGMLCGSLITRYTTDAFGRRTTLMGTALPFIIGTLFVVSATQPWMLYVARFCWGLSSSAISPAVIIYISEIAAKEIRGRLSTIRHFMFTFGSLLTITVGTIVTYQQLSYMLVALSVSYFLACWSVPESPYFLLKEGKVARAKRALRILNNDKDKQILEDNLAEMRLQVRLEMRHSTTIKELLTGTQYRKAIIIAIGLRLSQLFTGTIALQQYLGVILQETNSGISVTTGIIIYGAASFITGMVSSYFVIERVSRQLLLVASYTCATLFLATLGTLFFFHESLHKTPAHFGYITLAILMLFTISNNLGFDSVNFVIIAEVFPLNLKSTALTSLNILVAFLTFFLLRGYQLIKNISGLYGVFWVFACFALSGAIFSFLVVPETKGKSLREIQRQLQGPQYDEAEEKLRKDKETQEDVQGTKNLPEGGNSKI